MELTIKVKWKSKMTNDSNNNNQTRSINRSINIPSIVQVLSHGTQYFLQLNYYFHRHSSPNHPGNYIHLTLCAAVCLAKGCATFVPGEYLWIHVRFLRVFWALCPESPLFQYTVEDTCIQFQVAAWFWFWRCAYLFQKEIIQLCHVMQQTQDGYKNKLTETNAFIRDVTAE